MASARASLRAALGACGSHYGVAGLFSMAINLLYLATPLYMLQVYDRVLASGSEATLVMLTLAALLALVTLAAFDHLRARLLVRASLRLDRLLSSPVLAAMMGRAAGGREPGNSQALRDLDTFRQFATGNGVHALMDAPWTLVYVGAIYLLHPLLGLLALVAAVLLLGLAVVNELATRHPLRDANEAALASYGFTDAALRNAEVIPSMGMLPALTARWFGERQQMLLRQATASDRAAALTSLIRFVRMFMQIAVLGAGAWLVIGGNLSAGGIFAASLLLGRALQPVEQAVGSWRSLNAARQAYRRVTALLEAQPEPRDATPLPRPAGRLTLEGVAFVPPGATRPTLRGISFELPAGEALGIIGPTAAGKSTLARLLAGAWQPTAGVVRLDGADVANWPADELGGFLGFVPQDVELFAGTVAENIARFQVGRSDEVVAAAMTAGAHDMILQLPRGYDTEICEGGLKLSGGQRQRIALARAVFGAPSLVVLDEPNANLDAEGDAALVACMQRLREQGTTVVIVSHRPSALGAVDRLLHLQDGRIERLGSRDEVLQRLAAKTIRPAAAAASQLSQARAAS